MGEHAVEPAELDPILLNSYESPPDHPCAAIDHYNPDLALLNYLLQVVRAGPGRGL